MAVVGWMLAALAMLPQDGGERLVQASPHGFVSGFREAADGNSIEEWVPHGESVQRWTRMMTVQRFAGLATRASAVDYVGTVTGGLPQSCPGAQVGPVQRLVISGRSAARVRVDCPRNPQTGQPESFFFLAIAGEADMHAVQVAFRRVPTQADVDFARTQLESVRLER